MPVLEHQFDVLHALPPAPFAPAPAVALTRVKLTPVDAFTITAMLDAPGAPASPAFASLDVNAMSSKCALATLSTSSA
jgi:hypothetical protein